MNEQDFPVLNKFIAENSELEKPDSPLQLKSSAELLDYYDKVFSLAERAVLKNGLDQTVLEQYQYLVKELDAYLMATEPDCRHNILVVIPVADRPGQLQACLQSLLSLSQRFPYGCLPNGEIKKISVLIADDSKQASSIEAHQNIAKMLTQRGLQTEYFGHVQQLDVVSRLGVELQEKLEAVLGRVDPEAFFHKGASRMRNIAYLYLAEKYAADTNQLFYFVDSDQEFQVKLKLEGNDKDVYAVNYFHHLDRIFSRQSTVMLTGKVVGDPPVSPAVMAANFLDDVQDFLSSMQTLDMRQSCQFHQQHVTPDNPAAYHDMADLFGFKSNSRSYQYGCRIQGGHDHQQCLQKFAQNLKHFFDGEHPTRRTYFEYTELGASIAPARTVYTGNYIFNHKGLAYFIPFATQKLRMAGPTLGRILAHSLGEGFLTANLPMLHKRTVEETGKSEFRPGIVHASELVDLSVEFERQYFGDVMLFAMEQLVEQDYPNTDPGRKVVDETLRETEGMLRKKYLHKHEQMQEKILCLRQTLENPSCWWNQAAELQPAVQQMEQFIANMEHNFGSKAKGIASITSTSHVDERLNAMAEAILHYRVDSATWKSVIFSQ